MANDTIKDFYTLNRSRVVAESIIVQTQPRGKFGVAVFIFTWIEVVI
jgi:hypothetical protein